jgi:hypothetical protein
MSVAFVAREWVEEEIGPESKSKAAILDGLISTHAGIGNCLHVGGHYHVAARLDQERVVYITG